MRVLTEEMHGIIQRRISVRSLNWSPRTQKSSGRIERDSWFSSLGDEETEAP